MKVTNKRFNLALLAILISLSFFFVTAPIKSFAACESGLTEVAEDSCVDVYGNNLCEDYTESGKCCCPASTGSSGEVTDTTKQQFVDYVFGCSELVGNGEYSNSFDCFIGETYKWALGAIGVLAFFMIVIAGIFYMTSGGNPGRIGTAKKILFSTLSGVGLLLLTYTIVNLLKSIFG